MFKKNKSILFLLIFLIINQNYDSKAQEEKNANFLTLDACIETAIKNNPSFLSYQENLNAAIHQENASRNAMWPYMSLSWNGNEYIDAAGDTYAFSARIHQSIFEGGALYQSWKISNMDKYNAELDVKRQKQKLVLDVKKAWYYLLESKALEIETRQSLDRLHQHAKNAKHFFKEGWIWRSDVLEAEVRVARGEQALIIAENNVARAEARLNSLLHKDINEKIITNQELDWEECTYSFEQAKNTALTKRPDLIKTHINHLQNKASVKLAKSSYYPSIYAEAAWSKVDDMPDMHDGRENRAIILNASWKVWDTFKTKEKVAAANSNLRRSILGISEMEDMVILEVQEAWLSVIEADKKVNVLKKALAQGNENYQINIVRYQERLGTAKDVLDAQDLYTSTKKDYIAALASYLTSLTSLDYATGSGE